MGVYREDISNDFRKEKYFRFKYYDDMNMNDSIINELKKIVENRINKKLNIFERWDEGVVFEITPN